MNTDKLESLGACDEAIKWAAAQQDEAQAWRDCKRGDWMMWLCGKLSGPPGGDGRKKLVLAACACARLALRFVPDGELRPLRAIETAESWARDSGASLEDVKKSAAGAADDAYAYAAAGAADDAYAYAASAAYAAYAAAYASAASAAVAADAAYAAAYAAAARAESLAKCADIVREFYPDPPL